jgi:hypothetical protein
VPVLMAVGPARRTIGVDMASRTRFPVILVELIAERLRAPSEPVRITLLGQLCERR